MIFVHGGFGSGAQFESQAMRFESNGYPVNYVSVYEYDSTLTTTTMPAILAGLDQRIATLLEETGADQVDILGHSFGTTVMHAYLATPDRAAKLAHYVNIDGRTALAPPGGVPTLAIWAGTGTPGREIVGAINVTIPDQTHVQVATSTESFVQIYKFFTGKTPKTSNVLPEPHGQIRLAGRAVYFPFNVGVEGGTVQIWEIYGRTGRRIHKKPQATFSLGTDGAWGPFKAKGGEHYEFVVMREGASPHHLYFEPFIRSDYLIRLNTSAPSPPFFLDIAANMDRSDSQSDVIIMRYKEFWGDQGENNDVLTIDGVNIVNAATCPIIKRVISVFTFDYHADGISDLTTAIPFYYALTFLTGVDLHIPGVNPPNRTVSIKLTPRGGGGRTQMINIPNWASSKDLVSIQFNDYLQVMEK